MLNHRYKTFNENTILLKKSLPAYILGGNWRPKEAARDIRNCRHKLDKDRESRHMESLQRLIYVLRVRSLAVYLLPVAMNCYVGVQGWIFTSPAIRIFNVLVGCCFDNILTYGLRDFVGRDIGTLISQVAIAAIAKSGEKQV